MDGRKLQPEDVIKALRRLEKVHHEKTSKSYVTDSLEGEAYLIDEDYGNHADDDDENFVCINDGDLDEIFNEEELHEALATYQEVRKALRDQKSHRNAWKGKGKGKKDFGKSKAYPGPFRDTREAGSRRVHVEVEDQVCPLRANWTLGQRVHESA